MSRSIKALLAVLAVFGLALSAIGYVALLDLLPHPWNDVLAIGTIFIGLFFLFRQMVFTND